MDRGIWAIWFDVAENDRTEFFDWFHNSYLLELTAKPGHAWAAHYRVTGGGPDMNKLGEMLKRADMAEIGDQTGSQNVMLVGAASPHLFFQTDAARLEENQSSETRNMLRLRQGVREAIFSEEARITGPDYGSGTPGGVPGPAIQMGSFRMGDAEEEKTLATWYAQYRLPYMANMPGCIATRKLLSVAGWAKHSVLYEYTSLEARLQNFEIPHEAHALDEKEFTGRIVRMTIHAPGSPSIGERVWPPVQASEIGVS